MNEYFLPEEQTQPEEITHAVLISADRSTCYQALTTAYGWNAWFTLDSVFDPLPGGTLIFHWKNWGASHYSGGDYGKVIELCPQEYFSFSWHPDQPTYATLVELFFEDDRAGTIIRVRETGFADTPEGLKAMLQSAAGWGEALTLLKMYLEHGISTRTEEE